MRWILAVAALGLALGVGQAAFACGGSGGGGSMGMAGGKMLTGPGSYYGDVMAEAVMQQAYAQQQMLKAQAKAEKHARQIAVAKERRADLLERRARSHERVAAKYGDVQGQYK